MTIFNLGSINIDNFYQLPHLPGAGETIGATQHAISLGGKGANQSVAASLAGCPVHHIGAIGSDGHWCRAALERRGVDVRDIEVTEGATGHANICIDPDGENMIVLMPGANHALSWDFVRAALDKMTAQDLLVLQNETTLVLEAARFARGRGAKVIYSAAPFDASAVREVLPYCDLLVMNKVEATQLSAALGVGLHEIDVPALLVTKGAEGAIWRDQDTGRELRAPAFKVQPVDTTGAGDCFIGYVAAGLDQKLPLEQVLRRASAAAALQVTRKGTAEVMPAAEEVTAFLKARA